MATVSANLWDINRKLTINVEFKAPHYKIRFFLGRLLMRIAAMFFGCNIEFKKAD